MSDNKAREELFEDSIISYGITLPVTIDQAADRFMMPPYREVFAPPQPAWKRPTDDELREYLLRTWKPAEVGACMARRQKWELEFQARREWEATLRGRITVRYRKIRAESRERISEAWRVLRHGVEEDY